MCALFVQLWKRETSAATCVDNDSIAVAAVRFFLCVLWRANVIYQCAYEIIAAYVFVGGVLR